MKMIVLRPCFSLSTNKTEVAYSALFKRACLIPTQIHDIQTIELTFNVISFPQRHKRTPAPRRRQMIESAVNYNNVG